MAEIVSVWFFYHEEVDGTSMAKTSHATPDHENHISRDADFKGDRRLINLSSIRKYSVLEIT
jgi:hypothetical protein